MVLLFVGAVLAADLRGLYESEKEILIYFACLTRVHPRKSAAKNASWLICPERLDWIKPRSFPRGKHSGKYANSSGYANSYHDRPD